MLGKPGHRKPLIANRVPVFCEGIFYPSMKEAEKAYPGIKLRYRVDNPKFPEFYRVKSKMEGSASTALA
jgi:hypothetical protein